MSPRAAIAGTVMAALPLPGPPAMAAPEAKAPQVIVDGTRFRISG